MTKNIITITLDKDVIKALDEKAKNDERSRSGMVNRILKKSLMV